MSPLEKADLAARLAYALVQDQLPLPDELVAAMCSLDPPAEQVDAWDRLNVERNELCRRYERVIAASLATW